MKVNFLSAPVPLTKTLDSEGRTISSYPLVKNFTSHEHHVETIEDLYASLTYFTKLGCCMLKGTLSRPISSESRAGLTNSVYGKPNCPQCQMAKSLLDSRGIQYTYVDITTTGKSAAEITGRADVRSLPQIYLDGTYVGGFEALFDKLRKPSVDNNVVTDDNECKACEG